MGCLSLRNPNPSSLKGKFELPQKDPMPRIEQGTAVRHRHDHCRPADHRILMNLNKVIVALLHARMQDAVDVVLEREHGVHQGGLLGRAQVAMVSSNVHLADR